MHSYQLLAVDQRQGKSNRRFCVLWRIGLFLVLLGRALVAPPALAQSEVWFGLTHVSAASQDPDLHNNQASLCLSTNNSSVLLTTATVSSGVSDPDLTNNTASSCLDVLTDATIGDRVWEDRNGNGVQDAGEPGLAGFTVQLFDSDDVLLAETTTDSNGYYVFAGLFPGDYYLLIIPPATP